MASCHHHGQVLICITGDEEEILGSRSRSEDEGKKRSQQRNVAFKQQTCWCLDVRVRYTRFMRTGCCSKVPHILLCPIDALGTLEKPTIHDRGSAIWTIFPLAHHNQKSGIRWGYVLYIHMVVLRKSKLPCSCWLVASCWAHHCMLRHLFPMMVDEVSWGFLVHRLNTHSWMFMVG